MGRFLRLFTELPLDEVTRLEALDGAEINEAKAILATEATALCHGREEAEGAAETARRTFGLQATVRAGSPTMMAELSAGLPTIEIARSRLGEGVPLYDLLREAGLAKSNSEARRLIRGGGARVNDERFADETGTVDRTTSRKGVPSNSRPGASATRWCVSAETAAPRRRARHPLSVNESAKEVELKVHGFPPSRE